jgi:hypothetical protein
MMDCRLCEEASTRETLSLLAFFYNRKVEAYDKMQKSNGKIKRNW